MELALGTVQFGLNYGISNHAGKTHLKEVNNILEFADSVGISVIDTAASYGNSESVIGQLVEHNKSFRIITKVSSFNTHEISHKEVKELEGKVQGSLENLKCEKIYGVMFHDFQDVLKKNGSHLFYKLLELKNKGLIEKIGFSVYDGEQIDQLCDLYPFDLIQVPINVLDQRLVKSGHLSKLKDLGIEIYARSILLQGLLLMRIQELPQYFNPIRPLLTEYHRLLKENKLSLLDGALGFIKNLKGIDYAVIGVNNLEQLMEIKTSYDSSESNLFDYTKFACDDIDIIDPRRW